MTASGSSTTSSSRWCKISYGAKILKEGSYAINSRWLSCVAREDVQIINVLGGLFTLQNDMSMEIKFIGGERELEGTHIKMVTSRKWDSNSAGHEGSKSENGRGAHWM